MTKTQKKQKNINFNGSTLSPDIISYLNNLSKTNEKGEFIREAIKQHYLYITDFKLFIKQLVKLNFGLVRHILRKVGRENEKK